ILHHVAKHRFLRSTHLVRLLQRPSKKIIERLGALYHSGHLDRPRAQLDYYATAGSSPMVYGLGNRGAHVLADLDGVSAAKVDWTDKNRDAGRVFIEHTLLIAEVMIAFEVAVSTRADVVMMDPKDILARAPEATQRTTNPWKWQVSVPIDGVTHTLAHVPDKMFGLDLTAARKRVYFILEADRGTMPVLRGNLKQTSVQRKFLAYYHAHRTGVHKDRYGIGTFRVLTVTTRPQRIATMVDAVKDLSGGSGSNLFLFADTATLAAAPDVLTFEGLSGKGGPVRLID
ncbi:MAG: replication-relaxation family protein, partial [Hyphomicrobium sp.]